LEIKLLGLRWSATTGATVDSPLTDLPVKSLVDVSSLVELQAAKNIKEATEIRARWRLDMKNEAVG
jgi:hypothetical protein